MAHYKCPERHLHNEILETEISRLDNTGLRHFDFRSNPCTANVVSMLKRDETSCDMEIRVLQLGVPVDLIQTTQPSRSTTSPHL